MPPVFILLLLAFAAFINAQRDAFADFARKLADIIDQPLEGTGGGGGNQEQAEPAQPPPALPVPFAGEPSDAFADRYPDGVICTVATGLKYDPWRVIEQDGVFTRGAWIPLDAPFTAPLT